ncbi:MAG: cysteine desulfurase [Phycisphaerales bacterium]|nr:cysteine desulfurase [Phycisphaerales bacterium]
MQPAVDARASFDIERVRQAFPFLRETVNGRPVVYLDSAATAQRPQAVIDALANSALRENANVHRGVHTLSQKATSAFERARRSMQRFINAERVEEIIFVRGTTEAVNLVANSYGRSNVAAGDEIIISQMEHHSNIVPWQMLCEQSGATLRIVPFNDAGELDMDAYAGMVSARTKLVAVVHVSNALGTINPVKEIVDIAHAAGVPVLLDGAQAMPHTRVDVQDIGCDFYALSGHKMYGPTGIGVLYGRYDLLDAMPPWQGGGEMILSVSFETGTTFNTVPHKFEAGTPAIAEAVGLGATVDFLETLGMDAIAAYESELLAYATAAVADIPGVRLIGTASHKASVLSFTMDGIHPHDIGTFLDQDGVAIRTGHHCAQPVMERYGIPATARASFGLYNTRSEVDQLVKSLHHVHEVLG